MKDILQMVAVAAAVLTLGFLAYMQIYGDSAEESLVVRTVVGDVSHSTSSELSPATVGTRLKASDRVITGENGRIELTMGQDAELTLEGGSALELVGATPDGLVVELEEGRVQAVVRPGGTQLAVRTGEREVVAEDASFTVGLGDGGQSAVESRTGRVTLVGYGGLDTLEAGQRTLLSADGDARVESIPRSLLLEVEWPSETTREAQSRLVGTTEPGAVVWVDHAGTRVSARADSAGRFQLDGIPLDEGENALEVRSEGLLGSQSAEAGQMTRDSKPPVGDFEVQF